MNPERWQKIDRIFQAALERAPNARAAFIHEACNGDDALRHEVEVLLSAQDQAGSFLNAPAYAVAAESLINGASLAGQRIGHYQIIALLGKGGMGEVYRARDERLAREVAIKVLPAAMRHDSDRLKRFEQEARATSALNHPNILTVYDLGTADLELGGAPYIVAELLEGEELRAQLAAGALPVRKAIEYAQQIAAGLSAAHEKGIVHRDLKPENLFVTKDGRVKILDFGLAKLKPQPFSGGVDSETPTMRPPEKLTASGVVLGTVAYMSPEQVRGETVDHRSDIFSFGLILFEMLRGERAFKRTTMAETMAAILKDDPPELSESNAKISPQLEKIVQRCLEKKPELRFQSASDLGFALTSVSVLSSSGASRPQATATLPTADTARRSGWLVAGALALLALGVAYLVAYLGRPALEAEPLRLAVNPPEQATFFDWPAIAPDGRTLAFVAEVEGKTQLMVRSLGATATRTLTKVSDSLPLPFWSPDSRFIAYFDKFKLMKVALTGGEPETLCDIQQQGGGAWNREGVILLGGLTGGIQRVSEHGGALSPVTRVDTARGETFHWGPVFLPDGRHFLYFNNNSDPAKNGVYLAALAGGENRWLLAAEARTVGVAVSPTASDQGYLTFVRQGALMAQAFDFSRNQLAGEPVRIAERIAAPVGRWARYSLALNGTLALREKEAPEQLTWFDRTGKKLGTVGPPGRYAYPRISLDGRRIVVSGTNPPALQGDLYLFDLTGGTGVPFTFDPNHDQLPAWSPDGSRIVWDSTREGTTHLFVKAANGAGQDEVLLRSASHKYVTDWSPDGRFIFYRELHPQTIWDLWVLPLQGERRPWPWLNTPASEIRATFSPDGRWVAYSSNESGRNEIYVQAFVPGAPAAGGKRQLSTGGGSVPFWRRDGRELYYLAPDGKLMAVQITPGADLSYRIAKELFAPSGFLPSADRGYVPAGDGQRFLFVTNADTAGLPPFTVVLNWMTEVKQ